MMMVVVYVMMSMRVLVSKCMWAHDYADLHKLRVQSSCLDTHSSQPMKPYQQCLLSVARLHTDYRMQQRDSVSVFHLMAAAAVLTKPDYGQSYSNFVATMLWNVLFIHTIKWRNCLISCGIIWFSFFLHGRISPSVMPVIFFLRNI